LFRQLGRPIITAMKHRGLLLSVSVGLIMIASLTTKEIVVGG
jgi:hypothetical protein